MLQCVSLYVDVTYFVVVYFTTPLDHTHSLGYVAHGAHAGPGLSTAYVPNDAESRISSIVDAADV